MREKQYQSASIIKGNSSRLLQSKLFPLQCLLNFLSEKLSLYFVSRTEFNISPKNSIASKILFASTNICIYPIKTKELVKDISNINERVLKYPYFSAYKYKAENY